MNNLMLEALELDYVKAMPDEGEFQDSFRHTESYVKGLIGRPWWVDIGQLLNNEGPLVNMTVACMLRIIEAKDRIQGYKSYTNYLTSLYGRTAAAHNVVQLGDNMDPQWSTLGEYGGGHDPSSFFEEVSSESLVGESEVPSYLSEDEVALLVAFKRGGATLASARMDLSIKDTWTRYRSIKRKIAYHS